MAPSLAVGNLDGEISVWKTSSSCGTWPVLEIWNVYLPTARFVEDSPTRKSLSATGTGAAGVNTLAAGTAGPGVAGAATQVEAAGVRAFRYVSKRAWNAQHAHYSGRDSLDHRRSSGHERNACE